MMWRRTGVVMGRRGVLGAGLVLTGLVATACGSAGYTGGGRAASSASPAPMPAVTDGGTVRLGSTAVGTVLTDGAGRTLYLFEKDTNTSSTCYGSCAQFWPPATAFGPTYAGGGARANLVGSTARSDGSRQLTYAGHSLYYFSGDQQPGSVKGEGLKNFGAGWYVLNAQGKKIDND